MATKSTHVTGADVDVRSLETNLDQGESSFEYTAGFDAENALLLIEQLDGSVEVSVDGIANESISKIERVKVYLAKHIHSGETLIVRIKSLARSAVRISVAFFRRKISAAIDRLPCTVCKIVLRTVVTAVLAYVGVPHLAIIGNEPIKGVGKDAIRQIASGAFRTALTELLDTNIWKVILDVFDAVDWVLKIADGLYEMACQMLGVCPKTEAS
jgi:hypothetical protein